MKYSDYPRDMGRYESLIRAIWSGLPLYSRNSLDRAAKFLKLAMVASMPVCPPAYLLLLFLAPKDPVFLSTSWLFLKDPTSWIFVILTMLVPFILCGAYLICATVSNLIHGSNYEAADPVMNEPYYGSNYEIEDSVVNSRYFMEQRARLRKLGTC